MKTTAMVESPEEEISTTTTIKLQEKEENERDNWESYSEFFLSCLGYALGFGNIWRFPYLCYKNGGAVFLIPYVTMLLVTGIPMFFLEFVLGQYVSLSPVALFPKLSPIFSGLGWGMVVLCTLVAIYYNVILAWTLFYMFASFSSVLPWGNCTNDFNSPMCFTELDAAPCKNQSLYYYNKTCVSVSDYCHVAGLVEHNQTHCQDPLNTTTTILSANSAIRKISAAEDYLQNRVLAMTERSWENMGGLRWELVGCLALAWFIVGACLIKGVKSTGKVVYFTATFPYVVMVILLIRGVTLEGYYTGIEYYFLKPNISRLMELEVWSDAATQIFYSIGSSFGCLITLASYNKFNNNCMRDAIIIAFANSASSVFAGFVIFSILGFLATELGVEVKDVVRSGSGLVFVAYPAAINRMPYSPVWSIVFFLMLITVGLDTQFCMVETLTTGIFDQFQHLRKKKPLVVTLVCLGMFVCGLLMVTEGGVFMTELFVWQASGISLIIMGLVDIILVQYIYGCGNFLKLIQEEIGIHVPLLLRGYWRLTWLFLTPLCLALLLVLSCYYAIPIQFGSYIFPDKIQILGWFICASSVVCLPLGAIYVVWKGEKKGMELLRPTPEFCPQHTRKLLGKTYSSSTATSSKEQREGVFRYTYDNQGFPEHKDEIKLRVIEAAPPFTHLATTSD
ncbi:sodium- and chloride-dependent glycine transporter 1-like [Homarus americanus]|uniref:sodium- and chloride-dependent glycine transporter 1-like n=1 Tax=Homarus americanus TaxID=6706 RepID=UPI001C45661E|nr:sodium- and chloride-dependent glycine transporter 1-like [Homarus americanus]